MGMWQNLKGKRKFELWFKQTFKLRRNAADKNIHDFNILVRFFSTSFIKSAFCHQCYLKWLLLKFIHQVLPGSSKRVGLLLFHLLHLCATKTSNTTFIYLKVFSARLTSDLTTPNRCQLYVFVFLCECRCVSVSVGVSVGGLWVLIVCVWVFVGG